MSSSLSNVTSRFSSRSLRLSEMSSRRAMRCSGKLATPALAPIKTAANNNSVHESTAPRPIKRHTYPMPPAITRTTITLASGRPKLSISKKAARYRAIPTKYIIALPPVDWYWRASLREKRSTTTTVLRASNAERACRKDLCAATAAVPARGRFSGTVRSSSTSSALR